MLSLCLIASHMLGDFVFQTQYQAAHKFTNKKVLLWHCLLYTLAFVPVCILFYRDPLRTGYFLANIFLSHAIIDKQPLVVNHPWPLKQLFVDQTVHLCLLALYGLLFLRY